jgi:predicted DNA binding CopG/RHH family protein
MFARRKENSMSKTSISAAKFDSLVDENKEDVIQYLDLESAPRPGLEDSKRINIDLPSDFLAELDKEAAHRGITRQSLIKVWLYERLHSDQVFTIIDAKTGKTVSSNVPIQIGPSPKDINRLRDSIVEILRTKKRSMSLKEIIAAFEQLKAKHSKTGKYKDSPKVPNRQK